MAAASITAMLGGIALKPVLLVVPALLFSGWLFHSMTIEITDGELRWSFGPGWIRKRVPLDLVISAEPVRTKVAEGWGIHISRFGWLYNVSGFDAVAIRMKNGQHIALGTDEPETLAAHLAR
jgi:hypothetical protein